MSTIVVDAAMRAKLLAAGDLAEIRDERGQVIGRFVATPPPVVYVMEGELPSDEEIDRRLREGRSYSTEEVMERLRSLREKK
jgi:hypothetical protein